MIRHRGTARQSRAQSRAMAILAMPEHGQDARGTKSSRTSYNRDVCNTEAHRENLDDSSAANHFFVFVAV
jgi:hypothetical protein